MSEVDQASAILSAMITAKEKVRAMDIKILQLEQALESIAAHSPSERDRQIALKALGRGE